MSFDTVEVVAASPFFNATTTTKKKRNKLSQVRLPRWQKMEKMSGRKLAMGLGNTSRLP